MRSSVPNPKIFVMAAGLSQMNLDPRADFDDDLDYKLKRKLQHFYDVNADQLVDARLFHFPKVEKPHIGEHYKFLQDLVKHKYFGWWLGGVHYDFEHRQAKDQHVIVTFCRQGIHRSLGTARIIAEILRRQGFDVEEPYSLTPYREFSAKFCPVSCHECSPFFPGKCASFAVASDLWQSI